jgi:hypothetical protein
MKNVLSGAAAMAMVVGTAAWGQTATPGAAAAPTPLKTWVDTITIKGDIRYRYEEIKDDAKGTYTRQRDRIRARIGADAKLSDTLKGGVGLSTGGLDPVSGNQTLGDGFGKDEMRLDLAYLDWMILNKSWATADLVGGKIKNCFGTVMDRTVMDLVWDPDLNPEGLTLQAQVGQGAVRARVNGGYLWAQERSTGNDDTKILAGQTAVTFQFVPELYFTVGASIYDYTHMQGYQVLDWEAKNNGYGNSTENSVSGSTTNKVYANEYNLVEGFAELGAFVGTCPVTLYGQTVQNTKADSNDSGFLAGLTIGKAKNRKTAEVGYRYAELEKDAVVGAFTDSDRWGGGTDGHGHRVHARYQIDKNLQIGVTYFVDEKKISDASSTTDYQRLQADLVLTF